MRYLIAFCIMLISPSAAAQFDTPLIPASGGFSETIRDVDISGDVAVVATNGSGADEDTVFVFRRNGTTWLPDTAFVPPNAQLISGVAVHGERIVVGDVWADLFGLNAGAAYVYDYKNGAWVHTDTFAGIDTDDFDQFGADVSLTDSVAVVGAASGHPSGVDGAVYVFRLQADSSYAQEAKLFPGLAFFDGSFGENLGVSASPSGERVLSGQPTGKPGFPEAAYYYIRSGAPADPNGGWVLEDTTAAPPSQPDIGYGFRVAINGDLALVLSSEGTYVYQWQGEEWLEESILPREDGDSVALTTGSLAILGVEGTDDAAENAGALHLYVRDGSGDWPLLTVLTASDAEAGDLLGDETAVDGLWVVTHGTRKAWVFDISTFVALEPTVPATAVVLSVYPNPTREYATVRFSTSEPERVTVALFDLLGRELAVVDDTYRSYGTHRVRIDTASLAAGVYAVRVTSVSGAASVMLSVIR